MNPTRTKTPEQVEQRADYLRSKLAKIASSGKSVGNWRAQR